MGDEDEELTEPQRHLLWTAVRQGSTQATGTEVVPARNLERLGLVTLEGRGLLGGYKLTPTDRGRKEAHRRK